MTEEEFRKELNVISSQRDYYAWCLRKGFDTKHVGEEGDMMQFKDIPYTHQDFFQDMDILDKEEEHLREFYKNHQE